MFMKRFVFWLTLLSLLICMKDIWETTKAPEILLNRVGAFSAFQYFMLSFDGFDHTVGSASISSKIPSYIVHVITFFLTGLLLDTCINRIRKKVNSRKNKS